MASTNSPVTQPQKAQEPVSAFSKAIPMGVHMWMTPSPAEGPGDRERADAVAKAAHDSALRFLDYRKAIAAGYKPFTPELPQTTYHFVNDEASARAVKRFDPSDPPVLLYEKHAKPGQAAQYKLVGMMYEAPLQATVDELQAMMPLSIAHWHAHVNVCFPPKGSKVNWIMGDPKFGLYGDITTQEACQAAGGSFKANYGGWMMHLYPLETDKASIWNAGMDDDHGMHPQAAPAMKMEPGMKM